MSFEDIHALIARLVPEILEEDTAGEKGELDCFNVDICLVSMPGEGTDDIGNEGAEYPVEEEEKENDNDDDDNEFKEEDPTSQLECS
jgi:hypothetical protein